MITYSRLEDGTWGLRGPGLQTGARVTVTKRDGSTKEEVVGGVIWTRDGIALAAINRSVSGARPPAKSSTGCSCDEDCCRRWCRCDPHCNCRGGNIYDC